MILDRNTPPRDAAAGAPGTRPDAPPAPGTVTDIDFLPPGTPVDLTNCDREPIHVIGGVQPHGALLVVEAGAAQHVLQASANAGDILATTSTVVGASLADLVGAEAAATLLAAGEAASADDAGRLYSAVAVTVGGRPLSGLRSGTSGTGV